MTFDMELGRVVATASVSEEMEANPGFRQLVLRSLARHAAGDWGDVGDEDSAANDMALAAEERVISVYRLLGYPESLWVISEADRTSTTIFWPSEY